MKTKKLIKFEDIKERITEELYSRSDKIDIPESVTLVEGFLNSPFSNELHDALVVGGPKVPMIMLVGNESSKIYFIALKALLKDLKCE